jgi:triacylglycerol lipase
MLRRLTLTNYTAGPLANIRNKTQSLSQRRTIYRKMISKSQHKVYFIHGYAGPGFEMKKLFIAAEKEGFDSTLFSYRSMTKDIETVAHQLIQKIQSDCAESISFVTHSMGALVVRSMYNEVDNLQRFPLIRRIVMIAPPNNGTAVADFYYKIPVLRFLLGPNLKNLTTNSITGSGRYPLPNCEIGLITGSFKWSKYLNIFLKDDNDGLIIPEKASLGIEKDVMNVKSWHFGILYNKKVIKNVISFLKFGQFNSI